ncbi:hypothetical protein [Pannonibacter phragmitetus]|nr:hypothetical protein [Pannonibacter phragmitetus]
MLIRTAAFELEITRNGIFVGTRTRELWWDFTERPIFSRKTALEG